MADWDLANHVQGSILHRSNRLQTVLPGTRSFLLSKIGISCQGYAVAHVGRLRKKTTVDKIVQIGDVNVVVKDAGKGR